MHAVSCSRTVTPVVDPAASHTPRMHNLSSTQRCVRQHCVSWLRCSRQHQRRIESDTGRCHFAACCHRGVRTALPYTNTLAPIFVDSETSSAIAAVEISCGRHRRTPTQLAPYTPGGRKIPDEYAVKGAVRYQQEVHHSWYADTETETMLRPLSSDAWLSAATAPSRPARLQHRRWPRC